MGVEVGCRVDMTAGFLKEVLAKGRLGGVLREIAVDCVLRFTECEGNKFED